MSQPDKWEIALQEKSRELKSCQEKRGLKSCLGCEKVNACTIRDDYVKAVYESMNKGAGGGFEF